MISRWGKCFMILCSLAFLWVQFFGDHKCKKNKNILNTSLALFGNKVYHLPKFDEREYLSRQNKLFRLLRRIQKSCDDNLVILLGNRNIKRSRDINYNFFQDTDVLYLTGQNVPNEIYVLENINNNKSDSVLIFTNGSSEVTHQRPSNSRTFTMDQIETVLREKYNRNQNICLWYKTYDADDIATAGKQDLTNQLITFTMAGETRHGAKEKRVMHLGYLTEMLRLIKTRNEIQFIRQISKAVSEIFKEIMTWRVKDQIQVGFISSYFEFQCKRIGSATMAFRPVINNGHGVKNRPHTSMKHMSSLESTDWIMFDAGCHINGYATDVTRTWPLSGKVKLNINYMNLYKIVLSAHESCLKECRREGGSLETLNDVMLNSLSKGLQKLYIIPENLSPNKTREIVQEFCPHYVGHFIGLDVHDAPSLHTGITFQPGMVFTLEPGIYIPLGADFAPKSYHGLSVRIENMILITETGAEVLTSTAPIFQP